MPLVFVAIGFALLGVLIMGLSLPMARSEIEPNGGVGLRTADTLSDPEVWYAANAASGRELFRFGAGVSMAAVVLPIVLGRPAIPVLVVGTAAGLLALGIVASLRAAQLRARRELRQPPGPPPPTG